MAAGGTDFCCSSSFCSDGGELRSELEKLSSSSLGGHRIELFDLKTATGGHVQWRGGGHESNYNLLTFMVDMSAGAPQNGVSAMPV